MDVWGWIKNLFARSKETSTTKTVTPSSNIKVVSEKKVYRETERLTPNYSKGVSIVPRGVVFHHSSGSWQGDISWIMDTSNPSKGVYASYHCLINRDGERVIFGNDTQRMWHAGSSSWNGKSSCNDFMLGCSFSGSTYPNEKFGFLLNDDQIQSAIQWLAPRWREWNFSMSWITDHRQVSPGRKNDLNPTEWIKLRDAIQKQIAKK